MSINGKMTALADAIRGCTGKADKLSLDGMAAAVPEVFAAGEDAKAAEIDGRIFVGSFVGSGSETQNIAIPFEPDSVCLYCYSDAIYNADVQTIMLYHADLCSVGTVGSYSVYYRQKSGLGAGTSTASTLKRCVYQDGILTLTPRGEGSGIVFGVGSVYTVIAISHEEV